MGIVHAYEATGANNPAKQVSVDRWNAEHEVSMRLDLPENPMPDPPLDASKVGLFGRAIAGRMLPAFIGPSGLDSALQPLLARNKVGLFIPPGNANTVQLLGMNVSATGTATSANVGTGNIHQAMRRLEYAVTTASATAVAGVRSTALQYHIGAHASNYGGFTFIARFGPSRGAASNATRRFWVGMTSQTGAPTDTDPSSWAVNGIGVGCDTADTTWHIMHRNGSGVMVKSPIFFAPKAVADNTAMYEVAIFVAPMGATRMVGIQFTDLTTGNNLAEFFATDDNMPSLTQLLTWQMWTSVGGTSSVVGLSVASVYMETDF